MLRERALGTTTGAQPYRFRPSVRRSWQANKSSMLPEIAALAHLLWIIIRLIALVFVGTVGPSTLTRTASRFYYSAGS